MVKTHNIFKSIFKGPAWCRDKIKQMLCLAIKLILYLDWYISFEWYKYMYIICFTCWWCCHEKDPSSEVNIIVIRLNHLQVGTQQIRDVQPMWVQCWASIGDDGSILNQHWLNVSCFLGKSWCCNSKGPGARRNSDLWNMQLTWITATYLSRWLKHVSNIYWLSSGKSLVGHGKQLKFDFRRGVMRRKTGRFGHKPHQTVRYILQLWYFPFQYCWIGRVTIVQLATYERSFSNMWCSTL